MMPKFKAYLFAVLVGSTTQAVAQEQAAEGEAPAGEADGSVGTVNEPVKEAAVEVEKELDVKHAKSGYGNAGCGLGSLLFEPSNAFTQIFAATTNGSSGTQTFGITSGTSNCDAAGYQPGSATAFIQTNRAALAKDISRGKGATITGLTDLAGCTDARAVGKTLQKNFGSIFPSAGVSDQTVSSSMIEVLKREQALSCTNLG
jgi:hypothetical protein